MWMDRAWIFVDAAIRLATRFKPFNFSERKWFSLAASAFVTQAGSDNHRFIMILACCKRLCHTSRIRQSPVILNLALHNVVHFLGCRLLTWECPPKLWRSGLRRHASHAHFVQSCFRRKSELNWANKGAPDTEDASAKRCLVTYQITFGEILQACRCSPLIFLSYFTNSSLRPSCCHETWIRIHNTHLTSHGDFSSSPLHKASSANKESFPWSRNGLSHPDATPELFSTPFPTGPLLPISSNCCRRRPSAHAADPEATRKPQGAAA